MQMITSSRLAFGFVAVLALAACGNNTTERAATGALGGAVVAGPVGAVAGAAAGTVAE
jgi:osmotically inducible lipoprotein OsmB